MAGQCLLAVLGFHQQVAGTQPRGVTLGAPAVHPEKRLDDARVRVRRHELRRERHDRLVPAYDLVHHHPAARGVDHALHCAIVVFDGAVERVIGARGCKVRSDRSNGRTSRPFESPAETRGPRLRQGKVRESLGGDLLVHLDQTVGATPRRLTGAEPYQRSQDLLASEKILATLLVREREESFGLPEPHVRTRGLG